MSPSTAVAGGARDRDPSALDADPSSSANASFSFTSTEPGSTFECQLDDDGFSVCASPKAYTALTDGDHTFRVRATDDVSNTDPTPASCEWTIYQAIFLPMIMN